MEDELQSYPAEKIMSLILLESKNYHDAIKNNKLLCEVKEIRTRLRRLIRDLKDLYPDDVVALGIQGLAR